MNPYHLFSRFGIEAEYMIVDRGSLAVKPIADRLIRAAAGSCDNEITRGSAAWSNELALHLIEIKTNGPVVSLKGLDDVFLESVRDANRLLQGEWAALLGSGMHPFMVPERETKLWPHGNAEILPDLSTGYSPATGTAGPTCRASTSTFLLQTTKSSEGSTPRSGWCCR